MAAKDLMNPDEFVMFALPPIKLVGGIGAIFTDFGPLLDCGEFAATKYLALVLTPWDCTAAAICYR